MVDNHLQDSPITEMCRNFCNKVWNASRFVQMHLDGYESDGGLEASYSDLADRWILSQYNHTIDSVTASLGAYRFDEASRALYEFVWNSFCDWYVEMAKVRLSGEDSVECHRVQGVLVHVLEGICRLLHPMVPYVTEALWQELPHSGEALIVAAWPESDVSRLDDAAERDMAIVQEVVGAVRNIRGTMCVPPGRRADLLLRTSSETTLRILEETRTYICELARADGYEVGADLARPPGSASAVVSAIEVYVPLKGLIDVDVEKHRLMKEIDGLEKALSGLDKKLENEGFLKNAPAEVVETERRRHQTYRETLDKLQDSLAALTA